MNRIMPILLVIFTIAVVLMYVRPTWSGSIANTKTQIAQQDSTLAAANQFQQKEAELTQQEAQIPPESLERLNAFLPTGVDNVQLILDLNSLAARSGVTLSNFNINDKSGSGSADSSGSLSLSGNSDIDSLDISFSVNGSYDAFRSFLGGVEQSLRPLDITSLSVKDSDTGVYTYDMSVRLYWLKTD